MTSKDPNPFSRENLKSFGSHDFHPHRVDMLMKNAIFAFTQKLRYLKIIAAIRKEPYDIQRDLASVTGDKDYHISCM